MSESSARAGTAPPPPPSTSPRTSPPTLPPNKNGGIGLGLAKATVCKRLANLRVGSLTIHDGAETLHFGETSGETSGRTGGVVDGEPGFGGSSGGKASGGSSNNIQATITVQDPRAWRQVLLGGGLGYGEAYMRGHWSSPDLVQVIRLFSANLAVLERMHARGPWLRRLGVALAHALRSNTLRGARRNIAAHYDLGNDFFKLFLDRSMMYSSAVFPHPGADLNQAAEHKLDLICQQLQLQPGDHLLEIGTGWGGMALHAARRYGCRVTTTTISKEQYRHACERVRAEGLAGQVTLLCEDYRRLKGQYDKLVSIEMIEAVGHQFFGEYFRRCSALLKQGGLMALQAITVADQRYERARDSVDFIKRHIFPGGCLPSRAIIAKHLRRDTDMEMIHLRDITAHYAETLARWRERFMKRLDAVRGQGFDAVFERMWEFYLAYCEGGFRERIIGAGQFTFAKPGYRQTV